MDQMQRRICRAFRRNWRQVRAVIYCQGRVLFEFEKPWIFTPRRSAVEVDIAFQRHAPQDAELLQAASGDEGDESDGFSTPSDIADAVESLGGWEG